MGDSYVSCLLTVVEWVFEHSRGWEDSCDVLRLVYCRVYQHQIAARETHISGD